MSCCCCCALWLLCGKILDTRRARTAAASAVYIKNDGWLYLKQMSRHHMCMHCCSSLDYFLSFICQKLFLISSEAALAVVGWRWIFTRARTQQEEHLIELPERAPQPGIVRITQQVRNRDALLKRTRANAFINTAAAAHEQRTREKKVGAAPPQPGYFFWQYFCMLAESLWNAVALCAGRAVNLN